MQFHLSKTFFAFILLITCLTGCKIDVGINAYWQIGDDKVSDIAHIFVNGEYVGDTDENGFLLFEFDTTQTQVVTALTGGGKGEVTLTQQDYRNRSIDILFEEQDVYGEAELSVSSISSNTLDADFNNFDLSFENNNQMIQLRNQGDYTVHRILLYSTSSEIAEFTEDFHIVNGKLVPINFSEFKTKLLSHANKGELRLSVYAEGGTPDLPYQEDKVFFISQYTVNGKVSAPPSNANVPINNLEITLSYLGNGEFITKTVTNDAGEFSIRLPFGNWEFDAISYYNDLAYASKGSYLLDKNINLNINLLTVEDIQNGVPFFTVFSAAANASSKSALNLQLLEERSQREEENSRFFLNQKGSIAVRSATTSDNVQASAGSEGQTISDQKAVTIPQGVKEIKLIYNASTAEYPQYVTQQSIFNDVWSVSAFLGPVGFLFHEQRQVNSQLTEAPIWQSNGSTGDIETVVDVSSYTESGDFPLLLVATARNVGDSYLPTSVSAYIEYDTAQVTVTDVSLNNEFTGDYFSLPIPNEDNLSQRTFDVSVSTSPGYTESELTVAIEQMNGTLVQTIVTTTNLNIANGVISDVNVTDFQSTINRIPAFHNYRYKFIVKATDDTDSTNVIESDPFYSDQYHALWEMPDTLLRFGTRDASKGGDGWAAKGTYEWLVTHANLVTAINDISGEHGRYIGHKTHKRGTDIDIFLFHTMVTGNLDRGGQARGNYYALRRHVLNALQGNQNSLNEVQTWVTASRTGIEKLTALSSVRKFIYSFGLAGNGLPAGWARTLLEKGKLQANGGSIDLGLPAWSSKKAFYDNGHNDHGHITLNEAQLNNAP